MEGYQQNDRNIVKMLKSWDLESLSARVLLGVFFLLPLFALPFGVFAVDFNKAMLMYVGVSVSAVVFLVARIQKGGISFPKSFILVSLFLVALVWILSAVFSGNINLSLIGSGYETGTALFFLFLAIIAFLVAVLFRSVDRITLLYIGLFVSSLVLFMIQLLHTGFGLHIPPWEMFSGRLASVLGDWNDFGIFFGLTAILSLSCLELAGGERRVRVFLWAVLLVSIAVIFFVNFSTLQYVLGSTMLALLVYRSVNPSQISGQSKMEKFSFLNPTSFVFLVVVVFSVAHELIGTLINFLGVQFTQVGPTWKSTFDVVSSAISENPLLGSGPNTFSYDWLLFKPSSISSTIFWDTTFQSGIGRLPSMVAETGTIGAIALVTFVASILYAGVNVVTYREHNIERMFLVSSFLGVVYLWTFTVIYSPGFLVFAFAGIFTGVFVASLGLAKISFIKDVMFAKGTKKGAVNYLVIVTIIIGFMVSIYTFSTKYIAGYFYTSAISEASVKNNAERADAYLKRAIWLDPQDVYFRSTAEVGLLRLSQLISTIKNGDTVPDTMKKQFTEILVYTVQSAKNATTANPLNPENWMELGKVYEALLQFDQVGFKSSAIFAYKEALRVSPKNPIPLVSLARVELQVGDSDEALKYLNESLKIKSDLVQGHMMLAQIALSEGKLKNAIAELENTVFSNPSNPENIYIIHNIGTLYFQDGDYTKAQNIFEKLVSTNPNYVDAMYSLGLVYDKKGLTQNAIKQFETINTLIPGNNEVEIILNNLRSGRTALGGIIAPPTQSEAPVTKPTKEK